MFKKRAYHIHFVGIGGIGMSGIAELLLNLGYRVSGSDIRATDITKRLESLGGTIFIGHAENHVREAHVLVVSSAIKENNPEVIAARRTSIPVISRAEMLAELMRLKYSIAVAGTHGKTSTASIIASILAAGELDPTIVIGGKLKSLGSNAFLGKGDFIVAEADESDGSFLKMSPTISVITNIDLEHLDFYRGINDIKAAFQQFIDSVPFYGLSVLCLDCESVQDVIPFLKKRFTTYGITSQADFQAKNITFEGLQSYFTVYQNGTLLGDIRLNMPGLHNVYNSLAAIAVSIELEIDFSIVQETLNIVHGVQRRLEIKGEKQNITVIDDYAHHPTEVKATLSALKEAWPDRKLWVAFQPHRFSRTKMLFDDFARSFYQTDELLLFPIYPAGEAPIQNISSDYLATAITARGHKNVTLVSSFEEAQKILTTQLKTGDIFLTMGAGDIWKLGEQMLNVLDL